MAIILKLLDMMRFRGGPQDLPGRMPGAWHLAIVLAAAYVVEGMLAERMLEDPGTGARSMLAIALQFISIGALLHWRGFGARMAQTFAALAGVGVIFGVLSVLLLLQAVPDQPQVALVVILLLMFLWSLAVDGYIYHHALSISLGQGSALALGLFGLNFFVSQWVFAD